MAIDLTPELKAKLLNELQSLEMQLGELEAKKKQEEAAKASAPAPLSKEDEALEQIRIHDVPEYMRLMENRAMWDKRAAKKEGVLTPSGSKWLGEMLRDADEGNYVATLGRISKLRPDLGALLPVTYDKASIEMLLAPEKEKEQSPEDVRFKLASQINALRGQIQAYLSKSTSSTQDLEYTGMATLLTAMAKEMAGKNPSIARAYATALGVEYTEEEIPDLTKTPVATVVAGAAPVTPAVEGKPEGEPKVEPTVVKKFSDWEEDITKAKNNDPELEKIVTALSQSGTALSGEEKGRLGELIKKARPARPINTADIAKVVGELNVTYKSLVSQIAALKPIAAKMRAALSNFEVSPGQSYYIALKAQLGDAVGKTDFAGLANFGIFSGLLAKLKEVVNANPVDEAKAKSEVTGFIKSLNAESKGLNDKLVDALDASLVKNPVFRKPWLIDHTVDVVNMPGTSSQVDTTPHPDIMYKKGYPRLNRNDGKTYLAKEDLTAEAAKLKSSWELKQ